MSHSSALEYQEGAKVGTMQKNVVNNGLRHTEWAQFAGTVIFFAFCAVFVSDGLFNIDEFVIVASADGLYRTGSLAFQNGYEQFGADSLKLWFFVAGPHGLVPQYPVGNSYLGASLMGVLGVRGLILSNAVAAAATLFVTRALTRDLFGDEKIAMLSAALLGIGTFFLEYAFGIWPHAICVLLIVLALLAALRSTNSDGINSSRWALLSGLCVGIAALLRLDSVLILPPLAGCIYILARHPFRNLLLVGIGLAPSTAILSATNHYKFGSYNPLSYGQQGLADLSSHGTAIGIVVLAGLALFIFGRRVKYQNKLKASFGVFAAIALLLLAAMPSARLHAMQYMNGAWALFINAGAIEDPRPGVTAAPDGVLYFWGLVKKALAQSLPWLGILFVFLTTRHSVKDRRALWIVLVVGALWSFPFVLKAWHGGLGSNMRYFLPLLPLLCAVGAAAWFRLASMTDSDSTQPALAGFAGGLLAVAAWAWLTPSGIAGAQQILSTYLFLSISIASALAGYFGGRRPNVVRSAQLLAAMGMSVALLFGLIDLHSSQSRRVLTKQASDALAVIPAPSLVYGPPERFTFQIGRPKGLVALPQDNIWDLDLADAALRAGYRVYVPPEVAKGATGEESKFAAGPSYHPYPGGALVEISLRP